MLTALWNNKLIVSKIRIEKIVRVYCDLPHHGPHEVAREYNEQNSLFRRLYPCVCDDDPGYSHDAKVDHDACTNPGVARDVDVKASLLWDVPVKVADQREALKLVAEGRSDAKGKDDDHEGVYHPAKNHHVERDWPALGHVSSRLLLGDIGLMA